MKWHLTKVFFSLILISGCIMSDEKNQNEFFKPNWNGLNLEDFSFEFGEVIELESDGIKGIVLDFSEDEEGKWYGVCFLNKGKIFGRQIPNGFSGDCIDLLDFTFFHQSIIDNLKRNGKRKIDINKIGIGSRDTANNKEEIVSSFNYGIEQRNKEQTSCGKNLTNLNPVNECYFELTKIEK